MAEIWNHKKYVHFRGQSPILADEEYDLYVERNVDMTVTLNLKLADKNIKEITASPDTGFFKFAWEDAENKYSGIVFSSELDPLYVLTGVIEMISEPGILPDSDMGTFTATKPIGAPPHGKS